MDNKTKALSMADQGLYIFPIAPGAKAPLTHRGLLDASRDPGVIEDWWRDNPDAEVGVWAGRSGVVVLDIDTKSTVDGYDSLDKAWLEVRDSFRYGTPNGGEHIVYLAPADVRLAPATGYRGMPGVDRRGGNSYVVWYGPVPDREDFEPAPEWLCDTAEARSAAHFEGSVLEWYGSLTPGEPNALVKRAIERINDDMGHADMVQAQYNAIRLGAEGNPGVVELLSRIEDAWESRDPGNHTTPQDQWEYKFAEAMASGIKEYGSATELLSSLPAYNFGLIPPQVPDWMVVGSEIDKAQFSKVLNTIVEWVPDDLTAASILWNAPTTKEHAREWGLEILVKRIEDARTTPEPSRENPKLEEQKELERTAPELAGTELLTEEERAIVAATPTFNKRYTEVAMSKGFANPIFTRSCSWTALSLAFGFKIFIPVSPTDKLGVNLWNQTLGYSGSGKSRAIKFRDTIVGLLFEGDNEDQAFDLGSDSSAEGLHEALLLRDRQPSFLSADEASRFFKKLNSRDWMSGLDDTLSHWYEGRIDPSSKLRLKELRGKSALTSFHIQMFGTPDKMTEVLTRDMFLTGFLARFNWVMGDPPLDTDDRFNLPQQKTVVDFFEIDPDIEDLALDLYHAANLRGSDPKPVLETDEANARMSAAYKKMFRVAQKRNNWDLTEPSVTRLMEAMRKCAALTAAYRGSTEVSLTDALVAISAVEEWFSNLFNVAAMISASLFQKECNEIEAWIAAQGKVSRPKLLNKFGSLVRFGVQDIDARLGYLIDSGRVNREQKDGGVTLYSLNGSA